MRSEVASQVIGLFSRATGEGQRNAFEYGFVQRIHVASALAMRGLELGVELAWRSSPAMPVARPRQDRKFRSAADSAARGARTNDARFPTPRK